MHAGNSGASSTVVGSMCLAKSEIQKLFSITGQAAHSTLDDLRLTVVDFTRACPQHRDKMWQVTLQTVLQWDQSIVTQEVLKIRTRFPDLDETYRAAIIQFILQDRPEDRPLKATVCRVEGFYMRFMQALVSGPDTLASNGLSAYLSKWHYFDSRAFHERQSFHFMAFSLAMRQSVTHTEYDDDANADGDNEAYSNFRPRQSSALPVPAPSMLSRRASAPLLQNPPPNQYPRQPQQSQQRPTPGYQGARTSSSSQGDMRKSETSPFASQSARHPSRRAPSRDEAHHPSETIHHPSGDDQDDQGDHGDQDDEGGRVPAAGDHRPVPAAMPRKANLPPLPQSAASKGDARSSVVSPDDSVSQIQPGPGLVANSKPQPSVFRQLVRDPASKSDGGDATGGQKRPSSSSSSSSFAATAETSSSPLSQPQGVKGMTGAGVENLPQKTADDFLRDGEHVSDVDGDDNDDDDMESIHASQVSGGYTPLMKPPAVIPPPSSGSGGAAGLIGDNATHVSVTLGQMSAKMFGAAPPPAVVPAIRGSLNPSVLPTPVLDAQFGIIPVPTVLRKE